MTGDRFAEPGSDIGVWTTGTEVDEIQEAARHMASVTRDMRDPPVPHWASDYQRTVYWANEIWQAKSLGGLVLDQRTEYKDTGPGGINALLIVRVDGPAREGIAEVVGVAAPGGDSSSPALERMRVRARAWAKARGRRLVRVERSLVEV